ncbi:type IV pili twitching motility protein PilT [Candidatus Roizmanbacteria bacterium CG02_land_8_20_14_3_00_36_15]|nr:MAG: type IV pili twitching motility protein PilT [Candidatus Roizmanbacteria bacterium CG02_land_8_20_14_3_00_36_15]
MEIKQYLDICIQKKASDLHIIPGYYPAIRVNGTIYQLKTLMIIPEEESKRLILSILNDQQKEILFSNKQIDFAYQYNNYRFRCNAYFANSKLASAIRLLDNKILTIEQLNLPPIFHNFIHFNQGLILITGPTGEGKSTTLASLINEINLDQSKHIITIEDPIEYVYPPAKSLVSQRELYQDAPSWNIALKAALREDPNVVLVGEMRDYDSIQLVLTLAETGHLVFSSLHTGNTVEAINRIVDVFPSPQQAQIRKQLSSVLKVVIAQRLITNLTNTERIPALEILLNNSAVATIVRDGRFHMLNNVIATSEGEGMILFENYLLSLLKRNLISKETAVNSALRPKEFSKLMNP